MGVKMPSRTFQEVVGKKRVENFRLSLSKVLCKGPCNKDVSLTMGYMVLKKMTQQGLYTIPGGPEKWADSTA